MARGSNLPAVGSYNQALILDLIRRSPEGLSRVELADLTGLSAQTLTNVARRLSAEGFIAEVGKVSVGPGKPRTILALRSDARYALGVHLDPAVTTIVLVDLAGIVVAHREVLVADATSTSQLQEIAAAAMAMVTAEVTRDRVLGIGVAAPGPLDVAGGRLINPPLLPAWEGVPVCRALERLTGFTTRLEKDVTAAMIGELWVTPRGELDDAMMLYYGAGVGLGLSIMGTPVRGSTANAGNIAHLIVDPEGPACECGQRGCLGVAIEPTALLREAGLEAGDHARDTRHALDDLCLRALEGEPRPVETLQRTAERLARAVVEVDNLLDLTEVVVAGPVWARLSPVLAEALEDQLQRSRAVTTLHPIRVRHTQLGTDVAAVGAACLLLDDAFSARTSGLMIEA